MIYRMCFLGSRIVQTIGFLVLFTFSGESTLADSQRDKIYNETCTQYFTPCACDTLQNGDLSVFCFYVRNDEIYDVFNRPSAIEVTMRQLAIAFRYDEPNVYYADDFLGSSKAESITLSSYPNETRYIQVEKNAFKGSGNTTRFLSLVGFNVGKLDWDFLKVVSCPFQLSLTSLFNVNSLSLLPAWSPSLYSLAIAYSTGLYDMPEVSGSVLVEARFDWCNLNETSARNILQRMQNAAQSLHIFSLSGSPMIDRVPDDLKGFPHLQSLYLSDNNIQELKAGQVFSDAGFKILDLSRNNITTIESGAFRKGDYQNADVYLSKNPFTRFEASVFQPMLEDMTSLMNGTLHLNETKLMCGCDIEWLIKYNRRLLGPVSTGRCGNSTLFTALNPSGFNYCNQASPAGFVVPNFQSKVAFLVAILASVLPIL